MSSDAPQDPGPARQKSEDLDAEWEEFNKSGCPDFMLASKYVSSWAHNNLPNAVVQAAKYVPFLSQMVGEGHPPDAAGQQQQQRTHAGSTAAAAVHPTNAEEDQHAGLLHQARPQHGGQQHQQHGGSPGCGAPLKGLLGCASCSTGSAESAGGSAAGVSAGGGAAAAASGAPSHGGPQGPA